MRKFYILFITGLVISFVANSQEVISSSGDHFENGSVSISWTIGESVIETFSGTSVVLTQGFHQSNLSASVIYENKSNDLLIELYPNPLTDHLFIKCEKYEGLEYEMYDFTGKLLTKDKFKSRITTVNFSDNAASAYFIKILSVNSLLKTFQIIKK